MKTYLDCLPCLLSQALRAARAATDDENVHRMVINSVASMIPELSLGLRPPEIAQRGYQLIYQITGSSDPFHQAKIEANRAALAIYPRLKEMIANSEDPLLTACKLAIAGNSIDLAPDFAQVNTDNIIEIALASPLGINDYQQFRSSINDHITSYTLEIMLVRLCLTVCSSRSFIRLRKWRLTLWSGKNQS